MTKNKGNLATKLTTIFSVFALFLTSSLASALQVDLLTTFQDSNFDSQLDSEDVLFDMAVTENHIFVLNNRDIDSNDSDTQDLLSYSYDQEGITGLDRVDLTDYFPEEGDNVLKSVLAHGNDVYVGVSEPAAILHFKMNSNEKLEFEDSYDLIDYSDLSSDDINNIQLEGFNHNGEQLVAVLDVSTNDGSQPIDFLSFALNSNGSLTHLKSNDFTDHPLIPNQETTFGIEHLYNLFVLDNQIVAALDFNEGDRLMLLSLTSSGDIEILENKKVREEIDKSRPNTQNYVDSVLTSAYWMGKVFLHDERSEDFGLVTVNSGSLSYDGVYENQEITSYRPHQSAINEHAYIAAGNKTLGIYQYTINPQSAYSVMYINKDENGNEIFEQINDVEIYGENVFVLDGGKMQLFQFNVYQDYIAELPITFTPETDECSDLPADHWAHDLILELLDLELYPVEEVENVIKCRPQLPLPREEFTAWMLILFYGDELDTILDEAMMMENPFTDLDKSNKFYPFIMAAFEKGIINGDTNPDGSLKGTFRPKDALKRGEMLKIILEATELLKANGRSVSAMYQEMKTMDASAEPYNLFVDLSANDTGEWHYPYLYYMVSNGIIEGVNTNKGTEALMGREVLYSEAAKIFKLTKDLSEK